MAEPTNALTRSLPPISIADLQLHVAHACNLTCESCSHYSNHGHAGVVALDVADRWMEHWSSRVTVKLFVLLGGEPTIHPNLPAFVPLVRRHWPTAHIRIVTNGFFLHRHPGLPAAIHDDGNADLSLSVHHDSPEYRERLLPIFALIERWQAEYPFPFHVRQSYTGWTRRYHGYGNEMEPFDDGRPRQSWKIYPARNCKQLLDGKLWKCAPLAYLKMQRAKFDLSSSWDPYLAYEPLDSACTDAELNAFLGKEEESYCGMCPAERRPFALDRPVRRLPGPRRELEASYRLIESGDRTCNESGPPNQIQLPE